MLDRCDIDSENSLFCVSRVHFYKKGMSDIKVVSGQFLNCLYQLRTEMTVFGFV